MRPELTKRQRQILDFIAGRVEKGDSPPSVREIGKRFSFRSTNAVYSHLQALERKGYITKSHGHRNILLAEHLRRRRGIPIVGRVAAGVPVLAVENIEGYARLEDFFASPHAGAEGEIFLLEVEGDSMIDAGIQDGDYVVVKSRPDVENGEIGVVVIDDEATVKKIFKQKNGLRLQPANARHKPIYVKKSALQGGVRVAGKVIGIVRKM